MSDGNHPAVRAARRHWLGQAAGWCLGPALVLTVTPGRAQAEGLRQAILRTTGGAWPGEGRLDLELAELVENGNAVPVRLQALQPDAPVQRLVLLSERNPQHEVADIRLVPGRSLPRVATRMRLATSQQVVGLGQWADGSWWQTSRQVLVTLAACVEG